MKKEIITQALYWENQGEMPKFVPIPLIYEDDDIIIKVKVAMFGKALHRAITIGHPQIQPPRVLGTLLAGNIISENHFFPNGTRVVINPHTISNNGEKVSICPGAISQYVKIKGPIEKAVYTIPYDVDYNSAVYCELIACAMESIAKIRDTSNLIIIGCGLMSLIQIQIAKYWGIKNILCIYNHSNRKRLIQKFGARPIEFNEDEKMLRNCILSSFVNTENYTIIDSAGTKSSLNMLFKLAEKNSRVVLFSGYPIGTSLPVDANYIHYSNCQIIGTYHFDEQLFAEAMTLLKKKVIEIESLITGKVNWRCFNEILANFQNSSSISNIVTFD